MKWYSNQDYIHIYIYIYSIMYILYSVYLDTSIILTCAYDEIFTKRYILPDYTRVSQGTSPCCLLRSNTIEYNRVAEFAACSPRFTSRPRKSNACPLLIRKGVKVSLTKSARVLETNNHTAILHVRNRANAKPCQTTSNLIKLQIASCSVVWCVMSKECIGVGKAIAL